MKLFFVCYVTDYRTFFFVSRDCVGKENLFGFEVGACGCVKGRVCACESKSYYSLSL